MPNNITLKHYYLFYSTTKKNNFFATNMVLNFPMSVTDMVLNCTMSVTNMVLENTPLLVHYLELMNKYGNMKSLAKEISP